jgi:hypothetical protein
MNFYAFIFLSPATLTTDARIIFDADAPSESNIFCFAIQT